MNATHPVSQSRSFASGPEFACLSGSLRLASGFTLFIVSCNRPVVQQEIISELQAVLGPDRLRHVHLTDTKVDLLTDLADRVDPTYDGAVAVTGLETHLRSEDRPEVSRVVINLNHFRDRYTKLFPRPLVLVLPGYLLNAVARGAPDFFSVHSGVFHFEPPAAEVVEQVRDATAGGTPDWDGMSPARRKSHIEQLDHLLGELRSRPYDQRDFRREIDVLVAVASQLERVNAFDRSLERLYEAERTVERLSNRDASVRSLIANNIGLVLHAKGDLNGALARYREAERLDRVAFGDDHPKIAIRAANIGSVLKSRGDWDGALQHYEEAERINRVTFGEDHPKRADNVSHIASVLRLKGELDRAMALYQLAERIDRSALGIDHPNVARDINEIGAVLKDKGDLDGALAHYREAERIVRATYGDDHPHVAGYVSNIGSILQYMGDLDGALDRYREAERIDQAAYGEAHPSVARDFNNIGAALKVKGDRAGAITQYVRAFKIVLPRLGADAEGTKAVAKNLRSLGIDPDDLVAEINSRETEIGGKVGQ